MGQKLSVHLSDDAVANLDALADGLEELYGCKMTRSSALTTFLVKGAPAYLATQMLLHATVAKYQPGGKFAPLVAELEREQRMDEHDARCREWKAEQDANDPWHAVKDEDYAEFAEGVSDE